jgi:ERCC4-related helicase/intein/homing endonuclease
MILSPTRPLCAQIQKVFQDTFNIDSDKMVLITGRIRPEDRECLYKQSKIIVSTPQCVDAKTIIFTKEGPIKISEFFKKFKFSKKDYGNKKGMEADIQEKVLGYDGNKICFLNASKAWKLPVKEVLKIKTEFGNQLICTKDHPLLTINEEGEIFWKEASLLNKGDYIAAAKEVFPDEKNIEILDYLPGSLRVSSHKYTKELLSIIKNKGIKCKEYSRYRHNYMPVKMFFELSKKINFKHLPVFITDKCGKSAPVRIPKNLDNKLAYIIGAMLGDGHIGNRKGHGAEVVFSDLDRESVSADLKNSMKEIFEIEMKKDKIKGLIAYNSALASILASLGVLRGNKSKSIRVPRFIFFSNIQAINGFIKGIFDTDGNASRYSVSISSVSESFIQELKWLFLRIGIVGNIEKSKSHGVINRRLLKESEIFTFRFSGRRNLEKFLEVSPNKEKCKKLIETLNGAKKPYTRSKEILPVPKLMKRIREENRSKEEHYKFRCYSLDNLKSLSEKLEGKHAKILKSLLCLPMRWVKIKEKIELTGNKEVYDLTIENNHNFITNCIISHNCIANDLKNNIINLTDFSIITFDEAQHSIGNYSYTHVAKKYTEQCKNPLILGLTASPGGTEEKIKEICKNLFIEAVEIRTETDEDVKPYVKEIKTEIVKVELPENLKSAQDLLKIALKRRLEKLKKFNIYIKTKRELLEAQKKASRQLATERKPILFYLISLIVESIKIWHALELLETQSIKAVKTYLDKVKLKKTKSDKAILNDPDFLKALKVIESAEEHPKVGKLKEVIKNEIEMNKNISIIVFSHFRDNIFNLQNLLEEVCRPVILIGQGGEKGLTQKEQIDVIKDFNAGYFNCLITSPIGEEGLHIPSADTAIFYDSVPSEIRTIQRRGRVGRTKVGKIIFLLTKGTRDEGYYWSSYRKERKMKEILREMQNRQQNIEDYV